MQPPIALLLSLALSVATLAAATPTPACNADNPFLNRVQYANSKYTTSLETTIASFNRKGDRLNAARTRTVQGVSTFLWLDTFAAVDEFEAHLDDAVRRQRSRPHKRLLVPFVLYNLPDRDCAAKASDGELKLDDDGEAKYRQYVDKVRRLLTSRANAHLDFAVVVEPDSLANAVTNLAVPKCERAAHPYMRGVAYAVEKLGRMSNVALYVDAAHSNWLGWPGNLEPTAKLMKEVVLMANRNETSPAHPAAIRGFATNVSNYNGYNPSTPDVIYGPGPDNQNWSELRYAQALTPYLVAEGLPAQFIIDQGRSGKQGIRLEGGHWCNIDGAGFGIRPTTETGDCGVDALVWVKPGGESDGTSDETATRFDENCQSPDAKTPAPEAGSWFNGFVEMLVKNADPPLKPTW